MPSYVISYHLRAPGQDYSSLYKKIKELYPTWCWDLTSTWIVVSNDTAFEIRDKLEPYIDKNDKLLVCALTGTAAWIGFDEEISNWLKNNI